MSRNRLSSTAALAALALFLVPATAVASSTLLSGYGGPGEGNQAILGSTLIGGGSKGAGGGGSSTTGSGVATGTGVAGTAVSTQGSASNSSRSSKTSKGTGRGSSAGHTSKPPAGAYKTGSAKVVAESGGSGILGLSGTDAIYIILALALLATTAAVTGRVARGAQ